MPDYKQKVCKSPQEGITSKKVTGYFTHNPTKGSQAESSCRSCYYQYAYDSNNLSTKSFYKMLHHNKQCAKRTLFVLSRANLVSKMKYHH